MKDCILCCKHKSKIDSHEYHALYCKQQQRYLHFQRYYHRHHPACSVSKDGGDGVWQQVMQHLADAIAYPSADGEVPDEEKGDDVDYIYVYHHLYSSGCYGIDEYQLTDNLQNVETEVDVAPATADGKVLVKGGDRQDSTREA